MKKTIRPKQNALNLNFVRYDIITSFEFNGILMKLILFLFGLLDCECWVIEIYISYLPFLDVQFHLSIKSFFFFQNRISDDKACQILSKNVTRMKIKDSYYHVIIVNEFN